MVAQKPRQRHYSTGDEALDARIAELVAVAGRTSDSDLLEEMIKTCFRLDRDRSDRGEMKLVNAALKEFEPNLFIEGDAKLINFKYFFTRKVTFLKESDAFALLPGGFGTLDEAFELLTLMQTGKSDVKPIILLEEPGGTYWTEWLRFVEGHLLERGLISKEDLLLLRRTETVEEAVSEIARFYSNYQSQRYVDGRLVLRMLRLPPEEEL